MRRVKLPDFLIEARNFLMPAQREESSPEDIRVIFFDLPIHSLLTGRKSASPDNLCSVGKMCKVIPQRSLAKES